MKWILDNILATAATNGAVVVWNLNRPSRSKQDHVFSDHKRTVNKVNFHAIEPSWLISGSQDGTMKCFDLRVKEAIRTFYRWPFYLCFFLYFKNPLFLNNHYNFMFFLSQNLMDSGPLFYMQKAISLLPIEVSSLIQRCII